MSDVKIATRVSIVFATCVLIAIFVSPVSANDRYTCCKCTDGTWQQPLSYPWSCEAACIAHGDPTGDTYQRAAGTTCGADCSNAASNCGRNDLGYVWSIGTRCEDDWIRDDVYMCTQGALFKCTESDWECERNEECLPKHDNVAGPADGGACSSCVSCIPNGNPCIDATCCCEAVDPDCCSGVCVDKDSDPNNCGECGNVCGANAYCKEGVCIEKSPALTPPGFLLALVALLGLAAIVTRKMHKR